MNNLYEDEVYVLYNKDFKEYLAIPGLGYITEELSKINMFKSKEEAEEWLKDYVYSPEDFEIKKMKIKYEVVD